MSKQTPGPWYHEMYELLKSIDTAMCIDFLLFDDTDGRRVYDYTKHIRALVEKIEGGGNA